MSKIKYLNPANYIRYANNRLISLRIRYGSPMIVVSEALGERINFIVASQKEYFLRAKLSYVREKTTMSWIENHIKPGDVVYDIGSNVGAYSLLIGKKLAGEGKVIAFEPESSNYYSLNRNIVANQLSDTVIGLCMGFDSALKVEKFFLSSIIPGSATHSVGKPESEGVKFTPEHVQGVLTMSLDQFVKLDDVPFPDHIKIDVDGNEGLIIENAPKTLSDPRVKTLVIEIAENVSHGIIEKKIESYGFQALEREKYPETKHGVIHNILYKK